MKLLLEQMLMMKSFSTPSETFFKLSEFCTKNKEFIKICLRFSLENYFSFMRNLLTPLLLLGNCAYADFFTNVSDRIEVNSPRLSYGIAVVDVDNDGKFEFVVTGFKYPNLALKYKDDLLRQVVMPDVFSDTERSTIGVAACDYDKDGYEEVYFLNTDSYSGKTEYSDRLLSLNPLVEDLFELEKNSADLNYTAGRSVVCVDRTGDGSYGFYVANYGGPTRFYEDKSGIVTDIAPQIDLDKVTGGRAVVSGHILNKHPDIFASNERGPNFLYSNVEGVFSDRAIEFNIADTLQNGRGTALADVNYDGTLDILSGNWNGFHRVFVNQGSSFSDVAPSYFRKPSKIRTVISADFDNDGFDEVFLNNIGQPNKLFKVLNENQIEEIDLHTALETSGLGTGAAVADIDNDGVLELLISHGESAPEPLTLYKAKTKAHSRYLRVEPKNLHGAPARGATVILNTNLRKHAKTIDAGSGYLCQMEPVAHFGLRKNEIVKNITIRWTNGEEDILNIPTLNKHYTFFQGK